MQASFSTYLIMHSGGGDLFDELALNEEALMSILPVAGGERQHLVGVEIRLAVLDEIGRRAERGECGVEEIVKILAVVKVAVKQQVIAAVRVCGEYFVYEKLVRQIDINITMRIKHAAVGKIVEIRKCLAG